MRVNVQVDISSEPEVSAMIDAVVAQHGKLDVLVNNAARYACSFTNQWHERYCMLTYE